MACQYCGKPVSLFPPASHRSAESQETAAFYARIFPDHARCTLEARSQSASELMAKHRDNPNYGHKI